LVPECDEQASAWNTYFVSAPAEATVGGLGVIRQQGHCADCSAERNAEDALLFTLLFACRLFRCVFGDDVLHQRSLFIGGESQFAIIGGAEFFGSEHFGDGGVERTGRPCFSV